MENRREMMRLIVEALNKKLPKFGISKEAINCHHNYVSIENHFGENVYITRKGAIRAGVDSGRLRADFFGDRRAAYSLAVEALAALQARRDSAAVEAYGVVQRAKARELLDALGSDPAVGGVIVTAVGFVADHLEVLYDLDIEAADRATAAGLAFDRTACVNDDGGVMRALAARVAAAAG